MTAEPVRGMGPVSAVPEAALKLLVTQGFDATSVDELATAAGISRSTFFRRFGSKEDMVFADQDAVLARVGEALASGYTSPSESVVAAALAVFDHHTARPHASRLRHELLQKVPALRDRELVSTHRYEGVFRRWLSAGDDPGGDASGADASGADPDAGADIGCTAGRSPGTGTGTGAGTVRGRRTDDGSAARPSLGPDAAAVAFAAATVAVHNAFLRRWLRSPAPTVRDELATELHALGRLFGPCFAPPTADPAGMAAGDDRSGVHEAGIDRSGGHEDASSGPHTGVRTSGRVVVAVADASSDTDSILAAVRATLERRGDGGRCGVSRRPLDGRSPGGVGLGQEARDHLARE